MTCFSIKPRTTKYVKEMENYGKVVHKAAEAEGGFLRNKKSLTKLSD